MSVSKRWTMSRRWKWQITVRMFTKLRGWLLRLRDSSSIQWRKQHCHRSHSPYCGDSAHSGSSHWCLVLHQKTSIVSFSFLGLVQQTKCSCFSGKGVGLGSLASSQSVSFRQGTNVEFGSQSFNGSGGGPEPLEVAYSLDPVNTKNRDFHNPMYDAVQNNPEMIGNGSGGGTFRSLTTNKVWL